jgi:hypothetical protein
VLNEWDKIMIVSIYIESTKSGEIKTLERGNESLNTKITNLSSQVSTDSTILDTSEKTTRRKIDSTKSSIVDSMKSNNKVIVESLKSIIKEQAHSIDSLSRIHAEKHLTAVEKIDILKKIHAIEGAPLKDSFRV